MTESVCPDSASRGSNCETAKQLHLLSGAFEGEILIEINADIKKKLCKKRRNP